MEGLFSDLIEDPAVVGADSGVDRGEVGAAAGSAPGGSADQLPTTAVLAHEGTTGVTVAGTALLSGAVKHADLAVGDGGGGPSVPALLGRQDVDLGLLQVLGQGAVTVETSPAADVAESADVTVSCGERGVLDAAVLLADRFTPVNHRDVVRETEQTDVLEVLVPGGGVSSALNTVAAGAASLVGAGDDRVQSWVGSDAVSGTDGIVWSDEGGTTAVAAGVPQGKLPWPLSGISILATNNTSRSSKGW